MSISPFAAACVFLVSSSEHLAFVNRLRPKIETLPLALVALVCDQDGRLIPNLHTPFDAVFALPQALDLATHPAATSVADVVELLAKVKSEFGSPLAVIAFDDRGEQTASAIRQLSELRIPVTLVQTEAVILGDAFGIWPAGSARRWGDSRPRSLVMQSPRLALMVVEALQRSPAAEFAAAGLADVMFGAIPSALDLPGIPGSGAPLEFWIEAGCLSSGSLTEVARIAATNAAEVRLFRDGEPLLSPAPIAGIILTSSPALALGAAAKGWRAIIIDGYAGHYDGPTAQVIACDDSDGPSSLERLIARPLVSAWCAPAILSAATTDISMMDVIARDLAARWARAARRTRAKDDRPARGEAQGIRRFDAPALATFPLFPHAEFAAAMVDLRPSLPARLVILSHDWSDRTGVARPAKYVSAALCLLGRESVALEVSETATIDGLLSHLRRDDLVLFNSVGMFARNEAVLDLYGVLEPAQRWIYLHETEFTLDSFEANAPRLYARFAHNMRDAQVLCVSRKQASMLADRFGTQKLHVVYNTTSLPSGGPIAPQKRPIIAMLGTQQRRKGVELFSRTADLALRHGLDFEFWWIGQETEEVPSLYRSRAVNWIGRLDGAALTSALGSLDTFMLASVDDPFPLSVLEAMQLSKHVVCYAKVGTEEIIRGLPGCAVYESYTAESALAALMEARATPVDTTAFKQVNDEVFSLRAFLDKTMSALRTGTGAIARA